MGGQSCNSSEKSQQNGCCSPKDGGGASCCHSSGNSVIRADAFRWLFGGIIIAVALSAFLATVDYKLSHSTAEQELGATLRELRTAQSSMTGRVTDVRQTQGFLHQDSGAERK